ncbi:MAG: hybrid sensor histidine kinase/response regulator [Aphanocapsa sp. GSE-SYN-MK-11-07L]|jgi:chemosensory pili system protein ChpA (sensor histidine kinase/response regulator)|nr:hybrid sensor histidine kinase/response regulator [Aphanocapsa sp. GSE-SYN-MK-11-07L]
MQPEQQKRILGYFIEEAKEHLETIEHSLLNLQTVVEDQESMNEVFRAAHSVKGGAAMLGIYSIQQTAHKLEDYFKVLKENPIQVDQKLETLFLQSFDTLNELLEELQSPFGLSDEVAEKALQQVEPVFADLQTHLTRLVQQANGLPVEFETPVAAAPSERSLQEAFQTSIPQQLREMLQLFRQGDSPAHRQQLAATCQQLSQLGSQFKLEAWNNLIGAARQAIANPGASYAAIASVVIREIKIAQDLVLSGRSTDIQPSSNLTALTTATTTQSAQLDLSNLDPDLLTAPTLQEEEDLVEFLAGLQSESEMAIPLSSESLASLDALLANGADTSELDDLFAAPTAKSESLTDAIPLEDPWTENADFSLPEPVSSGLEAYVDSADFESLETLLNDAPELTTSQQTEFDALDALLDQSAADKDDITADLERFINDQPRPSYVPPRPRTTRRTVASGFEQTMKVPVKHLDSLGNLVGELVVNRNSLEDSQDRLRQFLDNLLYQVQQLGDAGQQMQDLYERSLLESSLLSIPSIRNSSSQSNGSSYTGSNEFDALEMDRFTGFHTLSQEIIERIVRVREAASDIEFVVDETEQTARMFRQVTTQVQEGLSRSRMMPFSQIADRLPRAVRDLSLRCGKQAKLEIEGRETLVDKGILERLYDPMTHLVNNAIYHGIESPEIRRALGKPPEGTIKIRAFYQGSQTIIAITDDGAGIDPEKVKAKALHDGLITPAEAEAMTRQDVYGLLFRSGFSTQEQADELAGRGVGMDVVRASIEEIRGVITTDSTIGKGTTFTIRLPLTLSIAKALCCVDNHCRIAFPIDGVEDMVDISENRLHVTDSGTVLPWRDRLLSFHRLSELLPYQRQISRGNVYAAASDEDVLSVVILRSADDLIAIQVDHVLGEQEIVIKQLSGPVPKPVGIAGVTVQGDGRVMPIADVLELIDLSFGRLQVSNNLWTDGSVKDKAPSKTEPLVLIVDDSITVRELLSLTFNKVGYRVEQARDGQEAWEKLRSGLPCDLVFCDIEMPRMDGLELLSRIQKDPELNRLPIAMLTSRGADRHRQVAVQLGAKAYFTKPYLEESLLDAANRMLNGEVLITAKPG